MKGHSESSEHKKQVVGLFEGGAPYKYNKSASRQWCCERCAIPIELEDPVICHPCHLQLLQETLDCSRTPENSNIILEDHEDETD